MSDTVQQFREMMERLEYPSAREMMARVNREMMARYQQAAVEAVETLGVGETAISVGCSPRTYLDRCEGLVPLKQKPEPVREIPAISADCYAAMKRFA